ncbi:MAG: serine hydrolase [Chloroflexota bacterium]
MKELQSQIQSIIQTANAAFGVSIHHLESDETLHINPERPFPLCSVLKIPVLCEAFRQMEEGAFTLEDRWPLTFPEKNIGSGILTYLKDGLEPTVYDLLLLMIVISDNTATDMVMNRLGVAKIDDFMKQLGLANIHMTMTIRGIFEDMGSEFADPTWRLTNLDSPKATPPARYDGRAFSDGPENNVSTSQDMTQLLALIFRGEVVNRSACDQMLHILLQQQLNQRLPRFLPEGTPFAHKTGTLSGIRNDAGILYVSETCHVAVTAFCRWDTEAVKDDPVAEHERIHQIDSAFGAIGKAVYDAYA